MAHVCTLLPCIGTWGRKPRVRVRLSSTLIQRFASVGAVRRACLFPTPICSFTETIGNGSRRRMTRYRSAFTTQRVVETAYQICNHCNHASTWSLFPPILPDTLCPTLCGRLHAPDKDQADFAICWTLCSGADCDHGPDIRQKGSARAAFGPGSALTAA